MCSIRGSDCHWFKTPESYCPGALRSSPAVSTVGPPGAMVYLEGTVASCQRQQSRLESLELFTKLPGYRSYKGTGCRLTGGPSEEQMTSSSCINIKGRGTVPNKVFSQVGLFRFQFEQTARRSEWTTSSSDPDQVSSHMKAE